MSQAAETVTEQENGPVTDSGAPARAERGSPELRALPPRFGAFFTGALSLFLVGCLIPVPPVGLIIAPLGLVPVLRFIAAGQRGVLAWGWVAFLLASVMQLFPDDNVITTRLFLYYAGVIVLPALAVELWQRHRWSEGRWAAVATLSIALTSLTAVAVLTGSDGSCTSHLDAERYLELLLPWYPEWIDQLSTIPITLLFVEYDAGSMIRMLLAWLLPNLPVAYLIIVLFWIRPRLPVLGFPMQIDLFEQYRSEEWLPAAFAVTGIATVLLEGLPRWVALNLLAAVLMLYFVHGLAIIRAHLARWIGRGWFARWGVALLSLQMPLPLLLAALGLADSFHQLRPQVSENGRKP